MCPELFKVFKLVNMYLLGNYDKNVQRGVLQATVLSFSLSLSEQKANILYYRVYIDTRDISA